VKIPLGDWEKITPAFAVEACKLQEEQYLKLAFEAGAVGYIDLMETILGWAEERRQAALYFFEGTVQ